MNARLPRLTALAMAAAVLACAALLACAPGPRAHALTLNRSGLDNVPADTVNIDYPLKIKNAQFSATDPGYVVTTGNVWTPNSTIVAYNRTFTGGRTLPGSFTLKWLSCGTDSAGSAIDLAMTVSNIYCHSSGNTLWLVDDGTYLCFDSSSPIQGSALRFDVEVKVTKHGTSTPASGTMLVAFTDIDMTSVLPEQITLLSGFGNTVWVPPTNFLSITSNNTVFTATRGDSDTYDSGFVATGNTAGFKLRWQGYGCGTFFLQPFRVNEQSVTASAGTGGSISDPGKTSLRWKATKTYTIKASAHYRIKDVKVDGKSVGAVSSYTFKEVTGHHTIQATFEPLPKFTVKFVDGFGATLSTQQVEQGAAATAPANPAHDGWAFIGWDKDFSKVTSNMTVTAKWDPVIAVRVPTLVACQIQPDGSVVAPSGYAIENLSPVPVALEVAATSGMPAYGSYALSDESGTVVHSYANGADDAGGALKIGVGESAPLAWSVGDIVGSEAQPLLLAALQGPAHLCDVAFTFQRA